MELVQKRSHYEDPKTGEKFPRVTTILNVLNKPALVKWSANEERKMVSCASADLYESMPTNGSKLSRESYLATLEQWIGKTRAHEKLLKKATEIGGELHRLIEWHLRTELQQEVGPEPKISDKALWAFMVFEEWRKGVNLVPLAIEQRLWSRQHHYAGTMDLYCELDVEGQGRQRAVVDWKTSRGGIYAEAYLQNAAYVEAWLEMGHSIPPLWGLIIRLPKDESDTEFETKLIPPDQQAVLFNVFTSVRGSWDWWNEEEKKSYKRWKEKQAKDKTA